MRAAVRDSQRRKYTSGAIEVPRVKELRHRAFSWALRMLEVIHSHLASCYSQIFSDLTVRHAAAKRITISLTFTHDGLEVGVADDGCGFDWRPHTSGEDRHYGLIGMQERIETLGGRFELESAPGRGTRVEFTIPSLASGRDEPL